MGRYQKDVVTAINSLEFDENPELFVSNWRKWRGKTYDVLPTKDAAYAIVLRYYLKVYKRLGVEYVEL